MSKKAISTEKAPAAIGPYSQAICTGDLLFISGQLGLNPETGKLAGDTVEETEVLTIDTASGLVDDVSQHADDAEEDNHCKHLTAD